MSGSVVNTIKLPAGSSSYCVVAGGQVEIPLSLVALSGKASDLAGSTDFAVNKSWAAGTNPGNAVVYIAPTGGATVVSVTGWLDVAEGGTSAVQPVIVTSGTTVTSGATLTTAAFNSNGTASVEQSLTLIASPTLTAGQGIGLHSTGGFTTNAGSLVIRIKEP